MSNNKVDTNYRSQKNRCSACGHRVLMHDKNGCHVVLGDGRLEHDEPCHCKRKRR